MTSAPDLVEQRDYATIPITNTSTYSFILLMMRSPISRAFKILGLSPRHFKTSSRKGSCPLKMYASINALNCSLSKCSSSHIFANANTFQNVLLDYKSQRKDNIHTIILDMESINSIDSSALAVLEEVMKMETCICQGLLPGKKFRPGLFTVLPIKISPPLR